MNAAEEAIVAKPGCMLLWIQSSLAKLIENHLQYFRFNCSHFWDMTLAGQLLSTIDWLRQLGSFQESEGC